jgi:Ser/Thr protein kinase RdoA (MazF antagonist)
VLIDAAEPIATAYGLGPVLDLSGPVARGEQGEVWRLRTERGTWAVKRSYGEFTVADAQRAGEFQTQAREAGVPTALAVPARDGRYGQEIAGTLVRVASWVEMLDPDPRTDPATVGAAVAALHRVGRPADSGPHPWYTDPVGAAGWDEILREARRQRAPFADRLAAFRDELLALEALLTPMEPVQTCHLDLWADNLRGTPDGGVTVLDWDNCGPGDPSRELAMVLFEFGRGEPARIATLYQAYRADGGPGEIRRPTDFGLLIAVIGNIGALRMRLWLDPATSADDRDRARMGLDLFLDDPLTLDTIDSILGALPA